jgi:hypothetical protein
MFVKMKGNHHTGLYLSGIFKTLLPRRDRATIYEIPDADALPAIEAGLYQKVDPEKVGEFFRLDHPIQYFNEHFPKDWWIRAIQPGIT